MEQALPYISLAGSVFSTVLTGFFWLVKSQRERPCIKAYLIDRAFYYGILRDNVRHLRVELTLIVANYSSLPNSVIGAKVRIGLREGGVAEVRNLEFDKETSRPFNLASLQSAMLKVHGSLPLPASDELEKNGVPGYVEHYLAEPREIEVQLVSLNERQDKFLYTVPAGSKAA